MAFAGRLVAMVLLVFAVMAVIASAEIGGGQGGSTTYSRKGMLSRFLEDNQSARSESCAAHKITICKKNNVPGAVKSRCCKDRCVNVLTDRYHCGSCGIYCSFGYACCDGQCVNVAYHKDNCGSCGVRCSEKEKCIYGMCSYA